MIITRDKVKSKIEIESDQLKLLNLFHHFLNEVEVKYMITVYNVHMPDVRTEICCREMDLLDQVITSSELTNKDVF